MPRRPKTRLGPVTKNARLLRIRRINETDYERFLRLSYARRMAAARRNAETPEMRSARLKETRERMKRKRIQQKRTELLERYKQLNAAQSELSDEQIEKRIYEHFNFDMNYINQAIKDQDQVIYCKDKLNSVVEASEESIPQENDKLIMNPESQFELVLTIKEEPMN